MILLKNDFNKEELGRWFVFNYMCWWCGKSHANCFHHALGRETSHILSAVPLNNFECHLPIHGILKTDKNIAMLLQKTLRHLLAEGYVLRKENDGEFLEKYKRYYETN